MLLEAVKTTLRKHVLDINIRTQIIGESVNLFNESMKTEISTIPDAVTWYGGVKSDEEIFGSSSPAQTTQRAEFEAVMSNLGHDYCYELTPEGHYKYADCFGAFEAYMAGKKSSNN